MYNDLFKSKTNIGMYAVTIQSVSLKMYVVKDSGACFVFVHVCRTVDRVVGHPRPSLSGIGVPWVSFPGPTDVP